MFRAVVLRNKSFALHVSHFTERDIMDHYKPFWRQIGHFFFARFLTQFKNKSFLSSRYIVTDVRKRLMLFCINEGKLQTLNWPRWPVYANRSV